MSDRAGNIVQLQAAFQLAKTTQDIDLMLSLWPDDVTLERSSPVLPRVCDQRG
ncbi:MAG: hypothetical protein PVSMB4_11810 [Ktedonobacterales bacterium]